MNYFIMTPCMIFLLHLFTFFIISKSQTLSDNTGVIPSEDSVNSTVQPNLAVVIGMLSVIFSLTFILLLYAKFCHRTSSSVPITTHPIHDGLIRSLRTNNASGGGGVDKTVVESLPFFRFSSLKGSREGLECAVCLAKFEDIEVLRLLPKCKHAFHIDCIDQWLEKHSTCPLCRQLVSANDLSQLSFSTSLRFLWNNNNSNSNNNQTESDVELFVEREESFRGSSRFSVGSSFRKLGTNKEDELVIQQRKEEELPIRQRMDFDDQTTLDKFNHRIVFCDALLKYRWSNVSSSDLMCLNSEMINDVSSSRFSSLDSRIMQKNEDVVNIKEEMERKTELREIKNNSIPFQDFPTTSNSHFESKILSPNDKRSMSEIVVHPRFRINEKDSSFVGNNVEEERKRNLWLPIAKKTVQWFANRERSRSPQSQHLDHQTLNV